MRRTTREALLSLRSVITVNLDSRVRQTVKQLQCLRRGRRAGQHVKHRPCRQVIIETGTAGKIPTIRTNYQIHPDRASIHSIHRRTRQLAPTALRRIKLALLMPGQCSVAAKVKRSQHGLLSGNCWWLD